MLVVIENLPEDIEEVLKGFGFSTKTVLRRRAKNEDQLVLKIYRPVK